MHPSTHTAIARGFHFTRRDVRLATGLVLFTYVTFHFIDHALGLFSVAVAEPALKLAVDVWQSVPGTLLLYGGWLMCLWRSTAAPRDR